MVKLVHATCIDPTVRLAPLDLVVASIRRADPTDEPRPVLHVPLPLPRDTEARIRPREDERESPPTRGVNIFDMV